MLMVAVCVFEGGGVINTIGVHLFLETPLRTLLLCYIDRAANLVFFLKCAISTKVFCLLGCFFAFSAFQSMFFNLVTLIFLTQFQGYTKFLLVF